jgi:phage FluMu protein Com
MAGLHNKRYRLLIQVLCIQAYEREMIIEGKKKHMNGTLCTHCGKDMAREENKVYLEVRTSLKKSNSYYNTKFVPTLCFLSVQTQCILIPKSSFSYTFRQ